MLKSLLVAASMMMALSAPADAASGSDGAKPTIVLVHGAFADSAGWKGVIERLNADGYPVVAAPNLLRSVDEDAASVAGLLKAIKGPVVLVGHSYGGAVITNAVPAGASVKALVYVAAFAPDAGESALALTGKFPGSTLGDAILPVPLAGGVDLYIQAPKFHSVFCADVSEADAQLMQETQRPVTQAALTGPSGAPAWKTIPSWFIYGDADNAIPAAAHAFMAERASAKKTEVIKDGSHAVMVSHPGEVAKMIEAAAQAN